jgi:hypothetical protein
MCHGVLPGTFDGLLIPPGDLQPPLTAGFVSGDCGPISGFLGAFAVFGFRRHVTIQHMPGPSIAMGIVASLTPDQRGRIERELGKQAVAVVPLG